MILFNEITTSTTIMENTGSVLSPEKMRSDVEKEMNWTRSGQPDT